MEKAYKHPGIHTRLNDDTGGVSERDLNPCRRDERRHNSDGMLGIVLGMKKGLKV